MVKLKIAAPEVPELVIDTEEPAVPVATLPRVIVAAAPEGPVAPVPTVAPVLPVGPTAPCGPSDAMEIVWVVGETTTVPPRESTIETV
jgi:hypothetical protein